ncbi:hypothetical protein D3Z48_08595, partial [Clostridiaceae bacterium]|nr:hypothetical protein [Clostridiaceae bacterium]
MVSMKELMSTAYKNHFAIPAVNVENADMLEGVISGAARVRAPVIIQLTEPAAEAFGAGYAAYLAKYFAAKFDVPVGLHLDHASNEEISVKESTRTGLGKRVQKPSPAKGRN